MAAVCAKALVSFHQRAIEPTAVHLNDLGHSIDELATGQSLEERRIDEDVGRLMESADQVLAERRIDSGLDGSAELAPSTNLKVDERSHLASDSAVNHGEKSGRDLTVAHAAHEVGRHKSDQISNHSTAEGEDDRVSGAAVREHPVLEGCLRFT